MKKADISKWLFLSLILCFNMISQAREKEGVPENVIENQKCFHCHATLFYYYYNDWVEKEVRARMNPYYIIDSSDFYISNHKSFFCTDCHSADYEEFPHDGALRMEPKYSCMDCHEGDKTVAEYNFEGIVSEYDQSIHAMTYGEGFTCWMCHNPHSYHIKTRTSEKVVNIVAYSNGICLNCHGNLDMYKFLSDKENPNILDSHEWLPSSEKHFSKVRCIECHAQLNDSILVAHKILAKEKAVKKCVECHSTNSLLMASLYKHQSIEQREKIGFINASILNEAYVIGATRNYILNLISLLIFGLVFIGIFVHATLRIILIK
jgi:hypothetical protein